MFDGSRAAAPELSVVAPVHNEADNVADLAREIARRLDGRAFEIIFVDDASTDDTRRRLIDLKAEIPELRIIAHRANAGQSRAVRTGVEAARAPLVATLDGDGQNDPADLPVLVALLNRPDAPAGLALIQGRRANRQDTSWRRLGSRAANLVRRRLLRDGADDSGCGVRVFRREAFLRLPYFDHMHRYLPALMQAEGYVVEVQDVSHRPRRHGHSNYTNFGRLAVAFSDMRGVMWLRRRRRPTGGVDEI